MRTNMKIFNARLIRYICLFTIQFSCFLYRCKAQYYTLSRQRVYRIFPYLCNIIFHIVLMSLSFSKRL